MLRILFLSFVNLLIKYTCSTGIFTITLIIIPVLAPLAASLVWKLVLATRMSISPVLSKQLSGLNTDTDVSTGLREISQCPRVQVILSLVES